MRTQGWAGAVLLAAIATCTPYAAASSPSDLVSTLRREGASRFADRLESDPKTLGLLIANAKTVFAPSDLFFKLQARVQSEEDDDDPTLQACRDEEDLISKYTPPGSSFQTLSTDDKLDGKNQVVVFDIRPDNVTGLAKRWTSRSLFPREHSNQTLPRPLPGMRLSCGLGKTTNIIKAGIKFDKGLIHITDGYFSRPQSLSNTSQATGQTTFANLAASGNLTGALDNMHSVTVFVPSNNALSSASSLSGSAAAELISNHVVSGFVGYLPALKDGAVLKTKSGQTLTIKVVGGRYYVNGALVTLADMILDNGVAHVIDKPLTPAPVTAGIARAGVDLTLAVLGAFGGIMAFALL